MAADFSLLSKQYQGISAVSQHAFADECEYMENLLSNVSLFVKKENKILRRAKKLVKHIPKRQHIADIESFLQEYSLNTEEGVAIMCIAEALLRIPDTKTADRLIKDKMASPDWKRHLGKSSSIFVNASSWALMLTGKVSKTNLLSSDDNSAIFGQLFSKMSEPVIRNSLKKAMGIIGRQFVMGETIEEAISNSKALKERGYMFSYDMLGEGARSSEQADKYFASYISSLNSIISNERNTDNIFSRSGISVKLSSLHPRYELTQYERVFTELLPRLKEIILKASAGNIMVSIDAEESSRLDISMMIFEELLKDPALKNFNGIGFVLQAYQKRAFYVVDWLLSLAKKYDKKIPVRLVKGAYWDSEIKQAQVKGLSGYPVFTCKEHTDISYLACAGKLLENSKWFYPQFATHNARTIASIVEIAGKNKFEFQRLRGMGSGLHDQLAKKLPCRVYAPVGKQEELLPYLIRRLLENGANTSFVNLLADKNMPLEELLKDPIKTAKKNHCAPNPALPLPSALFPDRKNSMGFDSGNISAMSFLFGQINKFQDKIWNASAIINGKISKGKKPVYEPSDNKKQLGEIAEASASDIEKALKSAQEFFNKWQKTDVSRRAELLEKSADIIEKNRAELITLLMREGGKNLTDSIAEVREAADFCRYYAAKARSIFGKPKKLKGPVGEDNIYSMHGRGVFLCISPWNFPLAIFIGQIAAALAAGNTVIAKPAEQTPLIAALSVKLLQLAGIPPEALHLLPGQGKKIGAKLVGDKRISGVAFTGSTETANIINCSLAARGGPIIPLIAETGGQNCMVVDSSILLEQTSDDIITSAFGSAGQRCSALRVLYVQQEIADDLLNLLSNSLNEIKLGNSSDFSTDIGPVIDANAKKLLETHIRKMKKEAKLISNLPLPDSSGSFLAPHIFLLKSIKQLEGEVFGPVLHIIKYKYDELDKVLREINSTGYGLTLGIQSRIGEVSDYIDSHVRAGNCYINRSMTGAVVGVQPFGGEGLSGTGPKAGGPYYLLRFASEHVISINTAAIGGSIEILS